MMALRIIYWYLHEAQVMGSSLTGLDTLFSSGLESWSSWQLDCSQPRGRVRRNGSNVMSGRAGRRESQQTGGDFQSFLALHHSNDSASDGPQSPATSIETQETAPSPSGRQIARWIGVL